MNKRRLLRLASILDKADAEHKKRGEPRYLQKQFIHGCGAPACALGSYAAATRRRWTFTYGCPQFKTEAESPFQDAAVEFGISLDESLELFDGDGCGGAKTAKQAAAYIRKFVKRHEA